MKKVLKWLILILPLILIILFITISSLSNEVTNEIEEVKTKEFTTKDNRVSFTVYEQYKQEEKGNYDLYLNKDGKQIVGVFTYNLSEYLESTAKEVLDNQVNAFVNTRKDMKIYKKETIEDLEDKKITRVEYSGKTDSSSDCVYIFSVIEFKSDPNYVVYVNEVVLKKHYELNIEEMLNILKSAKLK